MSALKIRCSALGLIMTDPRSKSETLSETTKTYLRELWIEENFGRVKDFTSKAIEKGLTNEEDAITMLSMYRKNFFEKNEQHFSNDFIKGTPDIIEHPTVYDTKCSWDIFSFMASEMTKGYDWQLRGYMALTGCEKATLAYCLTDTPRNLIDNEISRILFKIGPTADREEIESQVLKNMTYGDISLHDKVRLFHLEHDAEKIKALYSRIELCREYFATLSLSNCTPELITA